MEGRAQSIEGECRMGRGGRGGHDPEEVSIPLYYPSQVLIQSIPASIQLEEGN